jgi:hypothetical protein
MDQNPFLKQFINMRRSLHASEAPKKGPLKESNIIGKPAQKGTPALPDPTGITMAYIIENKPKDKEVIEYFKVRCEQLNEDT